MNKKGNQMYKKCNQTKTAQKNIHQLPETGFLRVAQIVKMPGSSTPALIPISRSSWLAGVKSGIYPQPVSLGNRMKAWRVSDVKALIEKLGAKGES